MEDSIKVVVADDNEIIRQMIVDSLNDDPHIDVVGEASDGVDAINIVKNTSPDIVLLDLVMPKTDGIGVMEELQKCSELKKRPQYIIISAAGREDIISQALQTGASYFFMKPFDGEALIKRIKHICSGQPPIVSPGVAKAAGKTISTENMVVNLLRSMGVPVKMVGYKYLRDAILIAVEDPDALMSVTKNIYPEIADEHGTSAGNVERNIRYVIESTWTRQEDPKYAAVILDLFKDTKKKPTNSEFILICSEWINFEINK